MKRIVIFGGNGTIGKSVAKAFEGRAEVIKVGRSSGEYQADIQNPASIRELFQKTGKIDAVISAAGDVAFAPVTDLTHEQWQVGINSKFLGQVNLATIALDFLNPGGSVTLTSGILTDEFINAGTSATAINAAVEGFAKSASQEVLGSARINVVSPSLLEESKDVYGDFFPGFIPVKGEKVAQAYVKSVLGIETGKVFKVFG